MPATTQSMTGEQRFLAALRREPVDATPVWFMRQAGRCLAEYRELRERYDILTMTRTPELCAQVTLMPVDVIGVDAAVMYADIMLPLYGMGVPFSIDPGHGPVIPDPIRTRAQVDALRVVEAEEGTPELFEAMRLVRGRLEGRTATIGFAGAPYTLASYMVEGGPSKEFARSKALMYGETSTWHRLMETLVEVTVRYLRAQVAAGAQALQLFDSWVGALSRDAYTQHVLPYTRAIFAGVRDLGVPLIHFGTGAPHLLDLMGSVGCDAVSVDWRLPIDEAWERTGTDKGIQGNLEPAAVLAPWPVVEAMADDVLRRVGGRPGHVFNLGHGVHQETDPTVLRRLVEHVHAATAGATPAPVPAVSAP